MALVKRGVKEKPHAEPLAVLGGRNSLYTEPGRNEAALIARLDEPCSPSGEVRRQAKGWLRICWIKKPEKPIVRVGPMLRAWRGPNTPWAKVGMSRMPWYRMKRKERLAAGFTGVAPRNTYAAFERKKQGTWWQLS